MVRCLRVARATAVKARSQAVNALRALVVTAPAELREQLRELPATKLASTAARLQLGPVVSTMAATKLALRLWASGVRRWIRNWPNWTPSWTAYRPGSTRLRQLCGVGPEIAGALLVAAGDDPGRLRSEAAFSMLCGASRSRRHRARRSGTG